MKVLPALVAEQEPHITEQRVPRVDDRALPDTSLRQVDREPVQEAQVGRFAISSSCALERLWGGGQDAR